jgi:hypothetical protein
MRFRRTDIKDLVKLLEDDDVLRVHQGVMGMWSIMKERVGEESQEELLREGIVGKLVLVIRRWNKHPLLYVRSTVLL